MPFGHYRRRVTERLRDRIEALVPRWLPSRSLLPALFVYLVLLANGVPAFLILSLAPGMTRDLFVWTVEPPASAQLLGVMYGNAILLVAIGLFQADWGRSRIILVLISYFSVAATIVTFLHLGPFLAHPPIHLAYWLTMYLLLVVAAPAVLVIEERAQGGRLPVQRSLSAASRVMGTLACTVLLALGMVLLFIPELANVFWPWKLTPLVAGIVGVWISGLGIIYGWAQWDGDWSRVQPAYWQGIPTGILLMLIPTLHVAELRSDPAGALGFYAAIALLLVLSGIAAAASQRLTRQ